MKATILLLFLATSSTWCFAQPGKGSLTKHDVNVRGCECEQFTVYYDISISPNIGATGDYPTTRFDYYWIAKSGTDKDCIIKLHPSVSVKVELPDKQSVAYINDDFNEDNASGENQRAMGEGSPDWNRLFCSEANRVDSKNNVCWDAYTAKRFMKSGIIITDFTVWNNSGYDPAAERNQKLQEEQMKRQQAQQRQEEEQKSQDEEKKKKEEEIRLKNEEKAKTEEERKEQELQHRREAQLELQKQKDEAKDQMMNMMGEMFLSNEVSEFFDELGFGMNLGLGMGAGIIPIMTNITPGNSSTPESTGDLGLTLNTDLWFIRNKYFGVGADGFSYFGFYTAQPNNSVTSSIYNYNFRAQAGSKKLKINFLYGREIRNADMLTTDDIVGTTIKGYFDYQVSKIGLGLVFDFSNKEGGDQYVYYMITKERPDFLPASKESLWVHKFVVRAYIDFMASYSNNYPIGGRAQYTLAKSNKDYLFFSMGKTFTLFKGKYKKN